MSFVCAILILLARVDAQPDWDTLRTTWNISPFSGFYPVPLTETEAISKGWEKLISCGDDNSPGNVYLQNDDLSSMPIYNAYGYISGIILGMDDPGDSAKNKAPFTHYTLPDGTEFWGVQGNFRDPTHVCNEQLSMADSGEDIGDRLSIANGNGPGEDYDAPLIEEKSTLLASGFKRGACFWSMGVHYWRYMEVDMDCDESYPIFLLYTGGKLNAWGIALSHSDRPTLSSKRWEHPGGQVLNAFFAKGETPTCLPKMGKLSTQHVFMSNPAMNTCPLW